MTPEERSGVLDVIATADHGCGECIRNLLETLALVFPDHDWRADFEAGAVVGTNHRRPDRRRLEIEIFEAAVEQRRARVEALKPEEVDG